jgi:hypothetical protein
LIEPGRNEFKIENTMTKINEDDLLRQLFGKIDLEEAPESLAGKIMEQIMVNPDIEPVESSDIEWWWIAVGLPGVLAMYFTGVFAFVYELITPYLMLIAEPFTGYFSLLPELFPSYNVVMPALGHLPVLLSGIIITLFLDILLKMQFRNAAVDI